LEYSSENNPIYDNTLSISNYGIGLSSDSNSNDIYNNTITQFSDCGISISSSASINVMNNILSFDGLPGWSGIYLKQSDNIRIQGNELLADDYSCSFFKAIFLESTTHSEISYNTIWKNTNGIYLESSGNNMIYHNNLLENDLQAYDDNNSNSWDNSYPSGGNYWSDYIGSDLFSGPNQDIPGSDGIGDTPYIIDSNSRDNYPLMNPIGNFTFLRHGWNFISLPCIQENKDLEKVLSQLDRSYKAVQWFNASDLHDPWKSYHVSKPNQLNDLGKIDHSVSFQIYVDDLSGAIFYYDGTIPIQNQSIPLSEGWNMVGYPSLTNHNRTVGLNNLAFGTEVDAIQWFDPSMKTWHNLDENDSFEIGRGYWFHATTDCVWEVPL
jgi:parallel beta-helix repeat protein